MKKWLILSFGIMVILSSTILHAQTGWQEVLSGLPHHLELSLMVQEKEGEVLLSQKPQKNVPSASIIKIPILINLMEEVEIAHKTGTLEYVRGDAGIIFGEIPIIISLFVENFDSLKEAEDAIGAIGRYVYETYGK